MESLKSAEGREHQKEPPRYFALFSCIAGSNNQCRSVPYVGSRELTIPLFFADMEMSDCRTGVLTGTDFLGPCCCQYSTRHYYLDYYYL